jgi:hypothetical protein
MKVPQAKRTESRGEFESECPGYCAAQDTLYMGTLRGVGRVYKQTVIDTYAKDQITATRIRNDRVVLWDQGIVVSRVLTDRGTENCVNPRSHEFELTLAVEH